MSVLDQIKSWLVGQGFRSDTAAGVTAGIYAESKGDPNAVNPTSGAFGIGQWLGSRKRALLAKYGPNPTLGQQLSFLAWELRGGDYGGAAVLNAKGADATLSAYITQFMRPAAGSETTGDLQRGRTYLYSTNSINVGDGSGRDWLNQNLGGAIGNPIADILQGLGTGLEAPAKGLSDVPILGDIVNNRPVVDLNSWFTRIALVVFALIFIAAALFAFKGSDALAIVSKARKATA